MLNEIPSFAIALPERRERIETELKAYGIIPVIFEAIDMRNQPVPANWTTANNNLGSTMSWIAMLQLAYDSGHELMAIYEDDFAFRPDFQKYLPDLSEITNLDFDVMYMTCHYAKGGTKAEPRRIPFSPKIVRAFGAHTLPARIFRRSYLLYLRDRIVESTRDFGIGADTVDAMLQHERRRTYAFECHIGGQRASDRRSWEPRFWDIETSGAIQATSNFMGWDRSETTPEDERATTAWLSRGKRTLAVNCSVRTLGLLSEGAIRSGGTVVAVNDTPDYQAYLARACDRLRRYTGYGVLSLHDFSNIPEGTYDGGTFEPKPGQPDDELLAMADAVIHLLEENAVVLTFFQRLEGLKRGFSRRFRKRNVGSFNNLTIFFK